MMSFIGAILVLGGVLLTFDDDKLSEGFTYAVAGAALVVADQVIDMTGEEDRMGLAPCDDVERIAPTFRYLIDFDEEVRNAQHEGLSVGSGRAQQAVRHPEARAVAVHQVGDR